MGRPEHRRFEFTGIIDTYVTTTHVVDPIHPGAVDCILHLGEFWNEAGIRLHRNEIFQSQKQIKTHYACAYGYLGAAGKIYENLETLYGLAMQKEELYKWIARIINRELSHKELKAEMGESKKQFAGAITPKGFVNYLEGLLDGYEKTYVLKAPVGADASKVLELFAESARYRGFDTEEYYCPIRPETKLEHLFIPALKIAFVTSNRFHSVEASELSGTVLIVDMQQMLDETILESHQHTVTDSLERYDELLLKGVTCMKKAKKQHDILEESYIPNMDFQGVEALRQKVLSEIKERP